MRTKLGSLLFLAVGIGLLILGRSLLPLSPNELTPQSAPDYVRGVSVILAFAVGVICTLVGASRLVSRSSSKRREFPGQRLG